MKKKMTWNKKFMDIAKDVAQWSKDKSTGVGAVIVKHNRVIATGYNGFPEHIDDEKPERHERPEKYSWTVHAEENAIISCARIGVSTQDAVMYCTWFPCAGCARMLVNAGIKKIVCGQEPDLSNEKFGAEFKIVLEMLHEADVDIEYELENRIFKIDVTNVSESELALHINKIAKSFKEKKDDVSFSCGCGKNCECND